MTAEIRGGSPSLQRTDPGQQNHRSQPSRTVRPAYKVRKDGNGLSSGLFKLFDETLNDQAYDAVLDCLFRRTEGILFLSHQKSVCP